MSEVCFAERPEEGYYIVAYDFHPNINEVWWNISKEGATAGIVGFTDDY